MPATNPMTRNDAYKGLEETRHALQRSVEGLTPEQLSAREIDGWSVKDMLAHIASWEELMAQDFRRLARGHAPALMQFSPERTDQLNDLIVSMRRDFSLDQVLTELASTRSEMMKSLEALSDADFETGFVPAFLGICGRHDEEHSVMIDAWRQKAGI